MCKHQKKSSRKAERRADVDIGGPWPQALVAGTPFPALRLSQVMFMSRSLRLQSDKNPSTDVLPTGVPAPLHQEDGDKVAACPIYCFFFPLAQHKN